LTFLHLWRKIQPKNDERFPPTFFARVVVAVRGLRAVVEPSGADQCHQRFYQGGHRQFFTWDTNHDQTLSVTELDNAIEDPANTGPAAAALAALKRASRSTNYTLPPLTLSNICQLAGSPPATNGPDLPGMYKSCLKRISVVMNHELFASGLPQLNTIRQGRMGDCFCLAPLGAMVHRDPREVASLFSTQTNGRVRVEFGGGAVSVVPPTEAECVMMAANGHDGVWINLYEKAIGQARNDQRAPEKRVDLPTDAIANGGSEGRIMSYLTGHKVNGSGFRFAKDSATPATLRATRLDELRRKLTDSTSQGRLMACGTTKPTTPGLTPKHAYALLKYDSKNDTVDLWNPHGNNFKPKGPPGLTNGYPTKNGIFTVPLTEFVQQFSGVSFESKFSDISLDTAGPADDTATLKVGDPAPQWTTGKWMQGKPVKKFSPGTAYLVEFWDSWCEPCRISVPYLNELQSRYKKKGLVVIGQDCWEHDKKEAVSFIKSKGNKMDYRIALEEDKTIQTWLAAPGRDAVPTAFLVDTNGRIAWIGHPLALKDQLIEDVLAGKFDSQKVAADYVQQKETKALYKQASDLVWGDKFAEAEAPLNHLLAETKDDEDQTAEFLTLRAFVYARSGRWRQAAADQAQAVSVDPSGYWNSYLLTPLLIQAGKTNDYQAHCKSMLDHFGNTLDPRIAEGTAKSCLLLPAALGPDDLPQAVKMAEKAITLSGKMTGCTGV
jgi:thiol-disulfide isomerase/thioredoxin